MGDLHILLTVPAVRGLAVGQNPVVTEGRRSRAEDMFVAERPWGQFQQFVQNEPVTVKIITVQPGHRLACRPTATGTRCGRCSTPRSMSRSGDREWEAQVGEMVWVPAGAEHRMANHGDQPGRLLEIAFGDFDEADIVRLHDDYARATTVDGARDPAKIR